MRFGFSGGFLGSSTHGTSRLLWLYSTIDLLTWLQVGHLQARWHHHSVKRSSVIPAKFAVVCARPGRYVYSTIQRHGNVNSVCFLFVSLLYNNRGIEYHSFRAPKYRVLFLEISTCEWIMAHQRQMDATCRMVTNMNKRNTPFVA